MAKVTGSYGIRVLDERLNGPGARSLNVLIGGPGTGKTVAALHFLDEGIRRGERVAHLTQARPEDVIQLAHSIGISAGEHVRSGDWVLIGYRHGFSQRYRRTIDPAEVFVELESLISAESKPDRIVLDTCGPLVEGPAPVNGAELLIDTLGGLGGTSLLTFASEDLTNLNSGFDGVSQRAALILRATLSGSGRRHFHVRKTLGPGDAIGPIGFEIRDRLGIVPASERPDRVRAEDRTRRRVLLLDVTGGLPEELRLWFEQSFELFQTEDPVDAFPELARQEFGLVTLHVDRRSVERGLHVMRQLRRAASRPPILVLCAYDLRASDRARALRLGADDFVSGGIDPKELASRVDALLRRRRTPSTREDLDTVPREPSETGLPRVERLRDIVKEQFALHSAPVFALVLLRPTNGKTLDALAEHVGGVMRRRSADRFCVTDEHVEVYLDGALASHAEIFLNRVRSVGWKRVGAVVYSSPRDRHDIVNLLED